MPKYRLRQVHQITMLYIFWFLHQTTTGRGEGAQKGCCISFDSYIKPQHIDSRHIEKSCCISFDSYIKPQLKWNNYLTKNGCISFDSYIKPQLLASARLAAACCISFESYIKPQQPLDDGLVVLVVYLLNPTSNHNVIHSALFQKLVVYLLNPTSNHNPAAGTSLSPWLYIFWILHQTTTPAWGR